MAARASEIHKNAAKAKSIMSSSWWQIAAPMPFLARIFVCLTLG